MAKLLQDCSRFKNPCLIHLKEFLDYPVEENEQVEKYILDVIQDKGNRNGLRVGALDAARVLEDHE